MRFFGLLHLSEQESPIINQVVRGFDDQVSIYLRNAIGLAASLEARGIRFTLLTNSGERVRAHPAYAPSLEVRDIEFHTRVPAGAKFYSAHFKLDAIRHLSTLTDPYTGMLDLDMICINALPSGFWHNVEDGIPMCYDISDQIIPAFGGEVVMRDLQSLHGLKSEGRWSGGEFLAGAPAWFADLHRECERIFPRYLEVIGTIHHVGDEAITSAALEVLRRRGMYIADAGTLGIVGRYWSGRTRHAQRPLRHFLGCALLHLPADKRFLAEAIRPGEADPATFRSRYTSPARTLRRLCEKARVHLRRLLPSAPRK